MMQNISELIAHPEKLTDNLVLHELRELIAAHPYYHVARLLYLRALYLNHDQSFGEELRRAAFYVSDRRVLFRLIEGDYYTLKPVLKKKKIQDAKEEGADRTQVLIDAFLNALPASENEGGGSFLHWIMVYSVRTMPLICCEKKISIMKSKEKRKRKELR